jgi:hypothetical protein
MKMDGGLGRVKCRQEFSNLNVERKMKRRKLGTEEAGIYS